MGIPPIRNWMVRNTRDYIWEEIGAPQSKYGAIPRWIAGLYMLVVVSAGYFILGVMWPATLVVVARLTQIPYLAQIVLLYYFVRLSVHIGMLVTYASMTDAAEIDDTGYKLQAAGLRGKVSSIFSNKKMANHGVRTMFVTLSPSSYRELYVEVPHIFTKLSATILCAYYLPLDGDYLFAAHQLIQVGAWSLYQFANTVSLDLVQNVGSVPHNFDQGAFLRFWLESYRMSLTLGFVAYIYNYIAKRLSSFYLYKGNIVGLYDHIWNERSQKSTVDDVIDLGEPPEHAWSRGKKYEPESIRAEAEAVLARVVTESDLDHGSKPVNPRDPSTWGKVSRNAPCPCGSGKKYKDCHGSQ